MRSASKRLVTLRFIPVTFLVGPELAQAVSIHEAGPTEVGFYRQVQMIDGTILVSVPAVVDW